MATSPTQRSLAELRKRGFYAEIVERWVAWPPPGHRKDLAGFLDVIVFTPGAVMGIQCCAGASHAARAKKIREHPNFPKVAEAMQVWVWSWSKRGERGARKVWTLRSERIE